MTDRELLELAAKAAGYQYMPAQGCIVSDGVPGRWNPLTDDGDALRLAVKLDIAIEPRSDAGSTISTIMLGVKGGIEFVSREAAHGDDPLAATRRAIVLAAAQIGKAQQAQRE